MCIHDRAQGGAAGQGLGLSAGRAHAGLLAMITITVNALRAG